MKDTQICGNGYWGNIYTETIKDDTRMKWKWAFGQQVTYTYKHNLGYTMRLP